MLKRARYAKALLKELAAKMVHGGGNQRSPVAAQCLDVKGWDWCKDLGMIFICGTEGKVNSPFIIIGYRC